MSFVLYAFLPDKAPSISTEGLLSQLNDLFGRSKRFSSRFESNPFTGERSVRVQWDDWSAILTCNEGDKARGNAAEARKRLGDMAMKCLDAIRREIHVFFADDPGRECTTEMVEMMNFLERIEGAVVFDPQQNKLLNAAT